MAEFPKPLQHASTDKTDAALASAAAAHYAASPALQLIAELLNELHERKLPWWQPVQLRELWPAVQRLHWLEGRPDLRQQLTSGLTGLLARSARTKTPGFQAELIDAALDAEDISVAEFEGAFDPRDIVSYGPAEELWRTFRARMPWQDGSTPHQELMAWLLKALVTDKSVLDGGARKPILTPFELRTAIPSKVWQRYIPIDVRVAIDDARFALERTQPGTPFHVINELQIATPRVITGSIPLPELVCVLDAAEAAMGLTPQRAPRVAGSPSATLSPAKPAEPAPAPAPVPAAAPTPAKPVEAAAAKSAPSRPSATTPIKPVAVAAVKTPPPAPAPKAKPASDSIDWREEFLEEVDGAAVAKH